MAEPIGIETRSRSRSKTPGLLYGENGDSKAAKKIPTVSLIEEEDDVIIVENPTPLSQPSSQQRPKRQRRSAKANQADESNDNSPSAKSSQKVAIDEVIVSSKQIVKSTTTVVTTSSLSSSSSSKQVINGSGGEKSEQTTTTTVTASSSINSNNNDVASEVPESQNVFNNIFNAIKTSTPILTNKRTKRITEENRSSSGGEVDYNAHPAYKEYKEAGEYWNKFPKTDYTYSELSPHRRELAKGNVAMPNMSRRSLEKYQIRVESMIQNNPAEESFLRRKFLNNMSYQKRSADLQYDSADEVDVSDLHLKLASRRSSMQTSFFRRFFLLIVSTFTTAYSNVKQGVRRIFYRTNNRYAYTPSKRHQQGILRGIYNSLQKFVLLCISKVYLFISTILCLDTWILYTRSDNIVENRKRKRFLLGLLIFFPLFLFGGTYIYLDPPQSISFPTLTLPQLPKITFPKISFPSISIPTFTWPEFAFPSWLKWPEFSFSWPSFSLPSWLRLPSFSFNLPEFSFSWLALPALSWPAWLALPEMSWPEWLTLSEFSLSWPDWLVLPSFNWPEWLKLPETSFSLLWPEWLKLPELSLPKFSLPSISFDFLTPIGTFIADAFTSLKISSIEIFDKIREATVSLLNEAQIVWNENFNIK